MSQMPFLGPLRLVGKLVLDAAAVGVALALAYLLRFDGIVPENERQQCLALLLPLVCIRTLSYLAITRNRLCWHCIGLSDLTYVIRSITLGSFLFIAWLLFLRVEEFPRSIALVEPFLTFNLMLGLRIAAHLLLGDLPAFFNRRSLPERRVVVVGAGDGGTRIARSMKEDGSANLRPVGFVDDDPGKIGRLMNGIPVLGSVDALPSLVELHNVDQVLIAIPSLPSERLAEIVRLCRATRVDLTRLPSLPELMSKDLNTGMIRKVRMEDLLEREPVTVDIETMASYTTGERILITGAGGSIGSELARQLVALQPEALILMDISENALYWIEHELRADMGFRTIPVVGDIRDIGKLETVFTEQRPTVVFHAAAQKHVPLMESNPEEAVKTNVFGTRNLVDASVRHRVSTFVMISTDKAVNPTSVMGASKRVAEAIVQSMAQRIAAVRDGVLNIEDLGLQGLSAKNGLTRFSSVRFGNVLGSNGSVIPTMQRQVEKGGPVTITHEEMVRYFMTIPEAVLLVLQAGALARSGDIFVLNMGTPVRIIDLANTLIRLCGYIPGVDIPIEVTGIRPGEKLYEEVLTAEEGTCVTSHDRIFRARPLTVDNAQLEMGLQRLHDAVRIGNQTAIRVALTALVPTFHRSPASDPLPNPQKLQSDAPPVPTPASARS